MLKTWIKRIGILTLMVLIVFITYSRFLSPTKIALINFPSYQVSNIILSNDSRFIQVDEVKADQASSLKNYDAILLFGPGLRLTKGQIDYIQKTGENGKAVYTFVFNSDIIGNYNVDSIQEAQLDTYYGNRCKENFNGLLHYVRKEFDTQKFFNNTAPKPIQIPSDIYYHLDAKKYFRTVEELTQHLKEKGLYIENSSRIALISGMTSPLEGNKEYIDNLIQGLMSKGYNVFPISAITQRVEMLKAVKPDAVIYLPMGRLGNDKTVNWLTENNVPLFCPYPVMQTHNEWINDPRGQIGGFLTARIVLPEVDGGICPLPISTQNLHDSQYYGFDTEPDRLEHFVSNVDNYLGLNKKENKEKHIAICYFKGPGQNSLVATGLEVLPSLYEFLKRLKVEGYNVQNLPSTYSEFETIIQQRGRIISPKAQGEASQFLGEGDPLWISKAKYDQWVSQYLDTEKYKEVVQQYGDFPGNFMTQNIHGEPSLAVSCIQFGNVAIFPQPRAALYGDDFKMVHGVDIAPPHNYIAPYLWVQGEFKADALIHFGTHGSLEFTPGKQTALSRKDWADCLVGSVPHFYYYSISNVGEGIIAKRRTHATLVSYLTPPFQESDLREQFEELFIAIDQYYKANAKNKMEKALDVKKKVVKMGVHKDLQLNADLSSPYTEEEILYIENFAEEISKEKITGRLYTLGEPYSPDDLRSTTLAICADPLAYSLAKLDVLKGKIRNSDYESNVFISRNYLVPVKNKLKIILELDSIDNKKIQQLIGVNQEDIATAHAIDQMMHHKEMTMESMMAMAAEISDGESKEGELKKPVNMPKTGKMPNFVKKMIAERKKNNEVVNGKSKDIGMNISQEDRDFASAIMEIENTLNHVLQYKLLLQQSPECELTSLLNALKGGYIAPSPGGDAVRNPNTLSTGRNLFSINAEATPSINAWDTGKMLANETLEQYQMKHDSYPKKISYTLWAGEFIESEGATIAQVLYMLGVEPIRDAMNRVTDLKLIPSADLKRPRIDVVVQTSGQLRDLAASRLIMITKAVKIASESQNDEYGNFVAEGTIHSEKQLVEKGLSPQEARGLSTMRVFGGLNGHYGTGIMGLVERGDAWSSDSEIAKTYLNNMGAIYGDDKNWGVHTKDLLSVALENTDVVIQPRQSNTWGALSLDHIYEFMGGINLSIRHVTGKEPDTYLADYRNRNHIRMQELREAIGIESRTTILNPKYIAAKMKGGASSANVLAKTLRNTYGWNVMKQEIIDNELWNEVYRIYVKDSLNLSVKSFFESKNPSALQEITAVMMETARKGLWNASEVQLEEIGSLHVSLVNIYGVSGSDFTLDNKKLQNFIATKVTSEQSDLYKREIHKTIVASASLETVDKKGMVLKKDSINSVEEREGKTFSSLLIVGVVLVSFLVLLGVLRRKRKGN